MTLTRHKAGRVHTGPIVKAPVQLPGHGAYLLKSGQHNPTQQWRHQPERHTGD